MGECGTFAVHCDDLHGGERAVCHGGNKIGRVSRGAMASFAVHEAFDEVVGNLLSRFGRPDHVGAQPPVLR